MYSRGGGTRWAGGRTPPQILADQLTLPQLGGRGDYAHQFTNRPPPLDFKIFRHPYTLIKNVFLGHNIIVYCIEKWGQSHFEVAISK